MKLLSAIRFDQSDTNVFAVAATPGEWVISGAFEFCQDEQSDLTGKRRQAFANGFLGFTSLGRSTFACVAEIGADELEEQEHRLAQHFVDNYGAPNLEAGLGAAREEIAFIQDLVADALINTVFTVQRSLDEDGEIREAFRTIQPPTDQPIHSRVWTVVDD